MAKTSHDSETPAAGQQVITACAAIHRKIKGQEHIFLARRAATKKFLPDIFELPGGHIDFGEDIVDGLKREILEEFGVQISVGDPFAAFTYANVVKGSHSIEVIYFASLIDDPSSIRLNPDDHSEARWFNRKTIEQAYDTVKAANDPEFQIIQKAFALLEGAQLQFD